MNPELPFQLAFLGMFVCMAAVRVTWARRAKVLEPGVIDRSEGRWVFPIRMLFVPTFAALVLAWVINPAWLSWVALPFPAWLRWSGVGVYAVGLALLVWVHWTLGTNFSHRLRIRQDHRLVTDGPYRWVRHPMYTSFLLLMTAFALVTSSALFAILPFGALLAILITRTPREEAMLEERFGDDWRAYRARTGALIPRLW